MRLVALALPPVTHGQGSGFNVDTLLIQLC
jgi:hypothetical protein